jgi:hypothetical protein
VPQPRRRRDANTRRADALLGYIIPLFFVALGGYQQITTGAIDKYVIGALLVFGLGALGWRIDVWIEKYIEMKARIAEAGGQQPADPVSELLDPPAEGGGNGAA